jgi:hypothetical protein
MNFSRFVGIFGVIALMSLCPIMQPSAWSQSGGRVPLHGTVSTMMSARAHQMSKELAEDVAKAKAEGKDVAEAERHKSEGDAALNTGHLRIAVEHYES